VAKSTVLTMIHGLIGSLDYFDPAGRITRADVRTIDLLGYGSLRGESTDGLTLQDQVEHVVSQIASWSVSPVWLLGHSMGGAIAMMLADQRPELVRGIINVEGNFTEKDAFWSSAIVKKRFDEWAKEYGRMCDDVRAFTQRCGIEPTERNVAGGPRRADPPDRRRALGGGLGCAGLRAGSRRKLRRHTPDRSHHDAGGS